MSKLSSRQIKNISKKAFRLSTLSLIAITIILSSSPQAIQAAANKVVTSSATSYTPGQTANLEIRIPKPTNINLPPFEVVFVVDASYSMATEITNMKVPMRSFADSLINYPGLVKVGIVSFGYNENLYDDIGYFPETHFPLTTISGNTDITNLKNAIGTNATNGVKASVGGAYSDLHRGLRDGNNLFSTGTSSGRFLVALTDGVHNYPAFGSRRYGLTAWDGQCVFTGGSTSRVPGSLNIANQRFNQLMLIPGGDQLGNELDGSFGMTPPVANRYQSPCGYILDYPNSNTDDVTGIDFIDYTITAAINSGRIATKEPDMTSALNFIRNTITPTHFTVTDQLNTGVFGNNSITAVAGVYDCSTNTQIGTANVTLSGSNDTINANVPYSHSTAEYCLRFTARVRSGAPTGNQSINSSVPAPDQRIRFYNLFNAVIATDNISLGSITIANPPNLVATAFNLANNAGASRSVFNVNENIYFYASMQNNGPSTLPAGTKTAIYKNRPSQVNANEMSDIPFYILNHGIFNASQTRTYSSWSGANWANNQNSTSPNSVVGAPSFWQEGNAADYSARVFANFQNSTTESTYPADNQRSFNYSVIRQPVLNPATTPTCTSASFTWTAGSGNITGYRLIISTGGNPVQTLDLAGNVSNANAAGLVGNTNYTWTLQANTTNGYSPDLQTGAPFTTPSCQSFNTTLPSGTVAEPGGDSATQDINMNYLPSQATWGNDPITISVVGIHPGSNSAALCAPYNGNSPAVTSGSGGASGITADLDNSAAPLVGTMTFPASSRTSLVAFLAASDSTPQGIYTICVGSRSTAGSANNPVAYTTFEVRYAKWIQIDSNAASRNTGDVHSNGGISFNIPFNQYFFKSVAGLVSANSANAQGLNLPSNKLAATSQWKVPVYQPAITSPAYQGLLQTVRGNLGTITTIDTATATTSNHILSSCSPNPVPQVSRAFLIIPPDAANNTMTRSVASTAITNANCPNSQIIYFVQGNLAINQNITDDTSSSGIVFIVSGNITIGSAVTRLDGAYIFGGSFVTQAGGQPLIINGSLIGLAGNQPTSNSGNFLNGATTGLQRDLGTGNNNPGETIRFQPKYLEILKPALGSSTLSWVE